MNLIFIWWTQLFLILSEHHRSMKCTPQETLLSRIFVRKQACEVVIGFYSQYLACVSHSGGPQNPIYKFSMRLKFGTEYLHAVIKTISKFQHPSLNTAPTLTSFIRHLSSTLVNFNIPNFKCPLYAYRARHTIFFYI